VSGPCFPREGYPIAIMEFESVEVARQWYESDSDREALRQAAADCNVIIATGFVPRNPASELA